MRNRRQLLFAAGTLLTLARPSAAIAQALTTPNKLVRIATLTAGRSGRGHKSFVDALQELGWVEGRNVIYDHIAYAVDDAPQVPDLAKALVARTPDLIYVNTGPEVNAMLAVTRTIPVVSATLVDPVEVGLIKDFARPGGNLTGIAVLGAETAAHRMKIAGELLPRLNRVGFLMTSSAASAAALKATEQAAGPNVTVIPAIANDATELDAAFNTLHENRIEALLLAQVSWTQRPRERKLIIDFALKNRVPLIAHRSVLVENGALLSYNTSLEGQRRRAAHIADKILKGASAAETPVELPTTFDLVINMNTARELGIAIPPAILDRADSVIE